ncbi:hypothetical protein ACVWY5_000177 [Bradyrhizobium sp. USDA 3256]
MFAEKIRLCPDGARVLAAEEAIVGYGFAHPWKQHRIPPLDGFLERLPDDADCLHVHDVAVLPDTRGVWHARMSRRSRNSRVRQALRLSRWSPIYSTRPLWECLGFRPRHDECGVERKDRVLRQRRDLHAPQSRCRVVPAAYCVKPRAPNRSRTDSVEQPRVPFRSRLENVHEAHIAESSKLKLRRRQITDALVSKPAVETWPVDRLRPYERNSRRHRFCQPASERGGNL